MDIRLRECTRGDEAAMLHVWQTVFGDDEEYVRTWWRFFGLEENGLVGEHNGEVTTAIYIMPGFTLVSADGAVQRSSAQVYALGTLPQARGHGMGLQLMNRAIELCCERGAQCITFCPAEDSLYTLYERRLDCMPKPFFSYEQFSVPAGSQVCQGSMAAVSWAEYGAARERLLAGRTHLVMSEPMLRMQEYSCALLDGALLRVDTGDGECCAVVERGEDGLAIKELLGGDPARAAALIAQRYGAEGYCWARVPCGREPRFGGEIRWGGMAAGREDGIATDFRQDGRAPWYGLALD